MTYSTRFLLAVRALFAAISMVSLLSLKFIYQISYNGLEMDNNYRPGKTDTGNNIIRGYPIRNLNRQAFNQVHITERNGYSKLMTKLLETEDKLVATSAIYMPEIVHDKSAYREMKQSSRPVSHIGGLTWLDDNTVVQGNWSNWSVMFCLNREKCLQEPVQLSKKVNQIRGLQTFANSPRELCSIAKKIEFRRNGQPLCEEYGQTTAQSEMQVLVVSSENVTDLHNLPENANADHTAVVWHLPKNPLMFPGGALLRMLCLITSLFPLRMYVHPRMTSRPMSPMQKSSEMKNSITDILRFVRDTHGSEAPKQWWNEVMWKVALCIVFMEVDVRDRAITEIYGCPRCFQLIEVHFICFSVFRCNIVKIDMGRERLLEVLKNVLRIVSSRRRVMIPLYEEGTALEPELKPSMCLNVQVNECLTQHDLIYILDRQRELQKLGEWIPVFPPLSSFKDFLHDRLVDEQFANIARSFTKMQELVHISDYIFLNQRKTFDTQNLDFWEEYTDRRSNGAQQKLEGTVDLLSEINNCSNYQDSRGNVEAIYTEPKQNVNKKSKDEYFVTVEYRIIVIRLWAVTRRCGHDVRFDILYNNPGGKNITIGLGENKVNLYVVDHTGKDPKVVNTITVTIYRRNRGLAETPSLEIVSLKLCGFTQDCSLKFDTSADCGVHDFKHTMPPQKQCVSGDQPGIWIVPCKNCTEENSDTCNWAKATWQPYHCAYKRFSQAMIRQCLVDKKLLFIGDSTNRGMSNYVIEKTDSTLLDKDKTHGTRVYTNMNNNRTHVTFAYYPHFWLPTEHRPTFHKVLYQLIKSTLPLQNNTKTVLVVGGVQWLSRLHIDLVVEALQRKGLSGITKIAKGIGAGFHQAVDSVKYVTQLEHSALQKREMDVLHYAKQKGFKVVATFNMTASRYMDFHEGKCTCHFHHILPINTSEKQTKVAYTVQGDINAEYSQILLNQICTA